MATFVIPKRVITAKVENSVQEKIPVQGKKSVAQIIETLPMPLKPYICDEIKHFDKMHTYHVTPIQKKISELQSQLLKLQQELEESERDFQEEKEARLTKDQENYNFLINEVKKAFQSGSTTLFIKLVECDHNNRKETDHHNYHAHQVHMCPPVRAIIEQLEEQGYDPKCFGIMGRGLGNITHEITCDIS